MGSAVSTDHALDIPQQSSTYILVCQPIGEFSREQKIIIANYIFKAMTRGVNVQLKGLCVPVQICWEPYTLALGEPGVFRQKVPLDDKNMHEWVNVVDHWLKRYIDKKMESESVFRNIRPSAWRLDMSILKPLNVGIDPYSNQV
jgi:hypothetical protein